MVCFDIFVIFFIFNLKELWELVVKVYTVVELLMLLVLLCCFAFAWIYFFAIRVNCSQSHFLNMDVLLLLVCVCLLRLHFLFTRLICGTLLHSWSFIITIVLVVGHTMMLLFSALFRIEFNLWIKTFRKNNNLIIYITFFNFHRVFFT